VNLTGLLHIGASMTSPSLFELPTNLRHDHVVGFYESEAFLTDLVVNFVSPALERDETVFVIASQEHHRRFASALATTHPELDAAIDRGQFVMVDAHETRRTLVIDGVLDTSRFRSLTGEMLAHAAARGRPLRIFGYMVALLWNEGYASAALDLEDRWNELASRHPFELMCAYPMSSFAGEASDAPFREVCEHHSAIANESYSRLGDPDATASSVVVLQREEPDAE
jgi:hypothetical protein